MNRSIFALSLSLLVAACAAPSSNDDGSVESESAALTCQRKTSLRPAYPVTACPDGEERDGLLCYPRCAEGYHGAGPVCWQDCPAGYTDDGATCRKDASIIGADNGSCPWYDKCGLVSARGCSHCPVGYANDGCTCRRDVDIFGKKSYGRGLGSAMICAQGQQQIGALCYGDCAPGWSASGIQCLGGVVCEADPPPPAPLYTYCFKVTRDSDITPCNVVVQQGHNQTEAENLVKQQNVGDGVMPISCSLQSTACVPIHSRGPHKPGFPND